MSELAVNHYKTLGVTPPGTAIEIKNAYRRLASKWHPDRHFGEDKAKAEAILKDINTAYDVLGNPSLKQRYDDAHPYLSKAATTQPNPVKADGGSVQSEFFTHKFSTRNPDDLILPVTLSVSQAMNGHIHSLNMTFSKPCGHCHGCGGNRMRCSNCHGTGKHSVGARVEECRFCDGSGFKMIHCNVCHGRGETETKFHKNIIIPAGVVHGSKVRIASPDKSKKSGVILDISIGTSDGWVCEGEDFHGSLDITFANALFGGKVEIDVPTGTTLEIKIPPKTDSGKVIRLAKMGLFSAEKRQHGDIKLKTKIVLPKQCQSTPEGLERLLRLLDGVSI